MPGRIKAPDRFEIAFGDHTAGSFEILVAAPSPAALPRSIRAHELPQVWQHAGEIRPGKVTLVDHGFELPRGTQAVGQATVSIILKRGTGGGASLEEWRSSHGDAVLTAIGSAGGPIAHYELVGAWITKITGPALQGKGGNDVAIEEVVIACEGIRLAPHHRTRARSLRHP